MRIPPAAEVEYPAGPRVGVQAGDRVRVRQQRWAIDRVETFSTCAILSLTGLEPDNLGQQRQVLSPFDRVEPILARPRVRVVRAGRWRRECRRLVADAGDAGILRTARIAKMDLLPYQLEPALAVTRGRGTRLLIADDVGLGKTVQAALLVSELRARGAAARVLVLAPAGLRDQWVDELEKRFGLRPTSFDTITVARLRRALPLGVNPWATEPLVIASIDYAKRPEVRPAVQAGRWDVVIVDEAHHVSLGSDRHDAVNEICRRAAYVVLLTATPHHGDPRAFQSLCDLGGHGDRLLLFRRTRQEVGLPESRRVHRLQVRPTRVERRMHAALDRFVRAIQCEPGGRERAAWLALSTLRKRGLSSAFALLRSVERRLAVLAGTGGVDEGARQLPLPLGERSGELNADDELPPWTVPALTDADRERRLLTRVAEAARRALGRESKLTALSRLIRRVRQPAIVFTEYRDTLGHLQSRVAPGAAMLHGGLGREERRLAVERFRETGLLLATDAAAEGLNLQHRCRVVINLELPWNPMRLEQRIGRVDRIGQRRTVHAFHLIAAGTAERRVLQRLADRVARARVDIGAPDPLTSAAASDREAHVPLERLVNEARREHDRLTLARRMAPDESTHPSSIASAPHALAAFPRRRTLRSALKGRPLAVFQSRLVAGNGAEVAYHLTPVLLPAGPPATWSLGRLEAIGAHLIQDPDRQKWLSSAETIHAAFWTTRRARDEAIANRTTGAAAELQPGLFDRRAEREWNSAEEHRLERAEVDALNARRSADSRASFAETPRIALLLFP